MFTAGLGTKDGHYYDHHQNCFIIIFLLYTVFSYANRHCLRQHVEDSTHLRLLLKAVEWNYIKSGFSYSTQVQYHWVCVLRH